MASCHEQTEEKAKPKTEPNDTGSLTPPSGKLQTFKSNPNPIFGLFEGEIYQHRYFFLPLKSKSRLT